MAADEKNNNELLRGMGFWGACALGMGAMIGAGVFILTGIAAGEAGPALILAFILNGLIAIIIGSCYAELSTMIPKTGGAYVWAKPALGDCVGFFTGWFSWFAQTMACAFYATAFGSFFLSLLNALGVLNLSSDHWIGQIGFGILISLILLGVNLKSSKHINLIQLIVTAIQIVIVFIFIAFALHAMIGEPQESLSNFTPFFPEGGMSVLAAMGLTFIAFEGYEIIVQSSEEVNKPTKTIPKAIFTSIIVVAIIYVLVAAAMLGGVETEKDIPVYKYLGTLGELGLIETAAQLMPYGKIALLFAALASTASALNATIYGSTRIALAMARDSDLPLYLSKISGKTHTPVNSILTTAFLIFAIIILLPIKDIAASTDIMFILVFMSVAASVIAFRKSRPDENRPFKVPFSPFVPSLVLVIGIALCISLYHISIAAWITASIWIIFGIVIYFTKIHFIGGDINTLSNNKTQSKNTKKPNET